MKRTVRIFLAVLLALALPFHAAYGIVMVQSMAAGDQAHALTGHGGPSGSVAASGHPAHHGHEAASGHHGAADDCHPHAHACGTDEDAGSHALGHCSSCTVCCTSVGLPGPLRLLARHTGEHAGVPHPHHPLTSIALDRLDRPPLDA